MKRKFAPHISAEGTILLKIILTSKLNGIVLQDRFVIFMSSSRNKCYEIKDMSAFDKLPIPFFIFVSSIHTSLLRCCLCSNHAPALSPRLSVTYGCEVRMCLGLPSRQPLLVVVSSVKRWRGKLDGNIKIKNRIIVLLVDHSHLKCSTCFLKLRDSTEHHSIA
jgi:hypothetical protein